MLPGGTILAIAVANGAESIAFPPSSPLSSGFLSALASEMRCKRSRVLARQADFQKARLVAFREPSRGLRGPLARIAAPK